ALSVFVCGKDLAGIAVHAFAEAEFAMFGSSAVLAGALGLVDVLAGLAFLFLPSLRAFVQYQREGSLPGIGRHHRLASSSPYRRRSFSQLVAAGCWGLLLGCGGGTWVVAYRVQSEGLPLSMEGVVAGGLEEVVRIVLVGLVAGFAVGAARPKARQ